jgi:hypothetical protein
VDDPGRTLRLVLSATADAAPETWRRLVAYLVQACATGAAAEPLPDPPTPRQVYRALLRSTRPQWRR